MTWFLAIAILAAIAALLPRFGLLDRWNHRRENAERAEVEDALKHIFAWEQRDQNATHESLAGGLHLGPNRILRIVTRMETAGLVESRAGALHLTTNGRNWALHVVRAHRLWERYLSDDARVPFARLHQAAEKAEHQLTAENLAELDAHLGHPQRDPHGDPIPRADGTVPALNAVALTDWPVEEPARIAHLEDEPDVIFQQILAADLRPGMTIRVLDKDAQRLVILDEETGTEARLAQAVAANIQVTAVPQKAPRPTDVRRLSDLSENQPAEVYELDDRCRGFSRRRLLDLGMTPGAKVELALENTFGDPRAFRVRGTLIALRNTQANQIWVRPVAAQPAAEPVETGVAAS